jgi:predicted metalloprotease with PDZ domain
MIPKIKSTMKSFKFLFVLVPSLAMLLLICTGSLAQKIQHQEWLEYHVSWNGSSNTIGVDLIYDCNNQDTTVFYFGSINPGGQTEIFDILHSVTAVSGDSIALSPSQRKITVYHQTHGIKKLHYNIDGSLIVNPLRARPNEAFRPVIKSGSLYLIGSNLFLETNSFAYKRLTIVWDIWPQNVAYFISNNPLSRPDVQQEIDVHNKEQILIYFGTDLIIKKYKVFDTPYYAITSKRDSTNMQNELMPFLQRFFPSTREFWRDYKAGYYFVSLIPLWNKMASTSTGYSVDGGFSMKYSGPFDFQKRMVLAHETSHHWISGELHFKSVGMEYNWFHEGFNDYIAVYNLARSKMLSNAEFEQYLNDANLKPHYNSPVNELAADSIESKFWTNVYYERLSYQRGFIYAFYFDNQIRLATQGKKNIRDFLVVLFERHKKSKEINITQDLFVEVASQFLPASNIRKEINENLLKGKLLDFKNIRLEKMFKVTINNHIPDIRLIENADLKQFYDWKN